MGVRGTEFFIAENGRDGETDISIIRGSIEIKPLATDSKPVEIKSGFSATIATAASQAPTPDKLAPAIELRKTTQEDLTGIQKSSELKPVSKKELPSEIASKMQVLEKKAVDTTLNDIKTYDPKLYAKLNATNYKTADEIHAKTVEVLMETAPKAPPRRKPYKSELENLEQGAYEKYFKIVE